MKNSRILIRTDVTLQIGTGHFMRCLTLAKELRCGGAYVRLISNELDPSYHEIAKNNGVEIFELPSRTNCETDADLMHSHWLPSTQTEDAESTIALASDQYWDWIIVDHYALDVRWESSVRGITNKIMVIDDLADRQHDCDLLLDQNLYSDMENRYHDLITPGCTALLGPKYALLRDEFTDSLSSLSPHTGSVSNVLVFFGGIDINNYTEETIHALSTIKPSGLSVNVVIGSKHLRRNEIEQYCSDTGYTCHIQTSEMAKLMLSADLSIGAGGSSTWERCCLGLPTVAISTAHNQDQQLFDAARKGVVYAPTLEGDFGNFIHRHILALLDNPALIQSIAENCVRLVDGKGTKRVAKFLLRPEISMRLATMNDSQNLFEWRNHSSIRSVSRDKELIQFDNHERWLSRTLEDTRKILLIGHIDGKAVGVVRFDQLTESLVEVSIYLVPDAGFTGQGANLLQSAEDWLRNNRTNITEIQAGVFDENMASKNLFLKAQYHTHMINYRKSLTH